MSSVCITSISLIPERAEIIDGVYGSKRFRFFMSNNTKPPMDDKNIDLPKK